jgi:hypothetical protein
MVRSDLLPRRLDISLSFPRTAADQGLGDFHRRCTSRPFSTSSAWYLLHAARARSIPTPRWHPAVHVLLHLDGGRRSVWDSWYRYGSSTRLDCRCSEVQSVSAGEIIARVTRRTMIDSGRTTYATRVDRDCRRNSRMPGQASDDKACPHGQYGYEGAYAAMSLSKINISPNFGGPTTSESSAQRNLEIRPPAMAQGSGSASEGAAGSSGTGGSEMGRMFPPPPRPTATAW